MEFTYDDLETLIDWVSDAESKIDRVNNLLIGENNSIAETSINCLDKIRELKMQLDDLQNK